MLIRFTLENWGSFRDRATFSAIANRERQHGERVAHLPKYRTRVLPIAAIYGGNASGKTNFFKALNFAKALVVRGTQLDGAIPVEPFLLDRQWTSRPTRFAFEILVDEAIYEYSFAVTQKGVREERLVHILPTIEKVLFDRRDGKAHFHPSLANDQFLNFAFNGTRENNLFLTNSVSQKGDHFRPIYNWFKDTLELIAPDTRFEPFERFLDASGPLYGAMSAMLARLDTGIAELGDKETAFDTVFLPPPLRDKLLEDVKEGMSARLRYEPSNDRYLITRRDGKLMARKLVAYHPTTDGKVQFEMRQESAGTQRMIDLLPVFLELSSATARKIFVVDELDRSLHTLLTRQLIELFLSNCTAQNRSQLLFTTHDVLLMDQRLFRRDELWVVERDSAGSSTLLSFSDYKDIRNDKDIRKSYLQGRLGGIPRLLLGGGSPVATALALDAQKDG